MPALPLPLARDDDAAAAADNPAAAPACAAPPPTCRPLNARSAASTSSPSTSVHVSPLGACELSSGGAVEEVAAGAGEAPVEFESSATRMAPGAEGSRGALACGGGTEGGGSVLSPTSRAGLTGPLLNPAIRSGALGAIPVPAPGPAAGLWPTRSCSPRLRAAIALALAANPPCTSRSL